MTKSEFKQYIEQQLINQYGVLVTGDSLHKALGFNSSAAFRKGVERGTVEIPIMSFKNRRGKYALSTDIAEWITKYRFSSLEKNKMN